MSAVSKSSAYPDTVQPGIPRLGMLPKGWTRAPMSAHLYEVRRPVDLKDDVAYDLVTVKRARGGVVKRDTKLGRDISVKTQFRVEAGDFLISKRQIVHGACGIVPPELHGSTVSNEYAVLRGHPTINLEFLKYLSHSIYFQQTCFHSSIGVHIEKMIFKTEKWLDWEFDLPPLEEQQQIERLLSTWERSIMTTRKLALNAAAQKTSLLQRLLPSAHAVEDGRNTLVSSTFGQVCEVTSGPAFESRRFAERGALLVRGSNVKRGNLDWDDGITERWPDVSGFEKYLLRKNDVVVAMDGYVGRSHAFIASDPIEPMLLVQRVARLRPTKIDPDLCYAMISSDRFFRHCEKRKTATAIAHITLRDISDFQITLPSPQEQRRIGRALATAGRHVAALEHQVLLLQHERAALLQQLLTGKRRLKSQELAA